jgi:DNA-binding NarL/FixJ family response regulator
VVNSLGRYAHAVQQARALHPEVILMETKATQGLETLKALRDAVPEAALIVLTSYPDGREEEEVLDAGACAYLLKTLDTRSLVAQIRESAP